MRNGHVPETVFVTQRALGRYSDVLDKVPRDLLITVSQDVFAKLTTETSPQGIFVVSRFLDNVKVIDSPTVWDTVPSNKGIIILHSLQDTGNVGTILRTAAAFDSAHCVISDDTADIYNHKTVRATMGALFSATLFITRDTKGFIEHIKSGDRRVYATALREDSISLKKHKFTPTDCFVIGQEGSGLPDDIIALCDGVIKIPISGKVESLNASVAATVILWELS